MNAHNSYPTGWSREPEDQGGVGPPPARVVEPVLIDPAAPPPADWASRRNSARVPLILFILTCASTYFVGTMLFAGRVDPATKKIVADTDLGAVLLRGLVYSVSVMSILTAHEMGHYLQARRYRIPASYPYFIPMPFGFFGTMGAVIVQRPGIADRKQMFDIGISGPLAGLCVAVPLLIVGIHHAQVVAVSPAEGGEFFGEPLLSQWIARWIHGPLPPDHDYFVNPAYMAGWVGFFLTAVNLMPFGQLDGGHILYCLVLRRFRTISKWLFRLVVAAVIIGVWRGNDDLTLWWLMLLLIAMMGTAHPPTADDSVPLGRPRIVLGWLTLCFVFVGFTPTPIYRKEPQPVREHLVPTAPEVVHGAVRSSTVRSAVRAGVDGGQPAAAAGGPWTEETGRPAAHSG